MTTLKAEGKTLDVHGRKHGVGLCAAGTESLRNVTWVAETNNA
eukprot:CAMPEP_0171062008 /NCGR_PEP_ID=MMETSP0766_2-20121228/4803_1 /TAXON_ID=439317 /ORGANISM="Gambierdiscus australes, Strain CAWD 149" /LENGTH=42 /DNA_ID= /DNA_START= /DNA_END= /DNA_ORIENTATION=